MFAEVSQKRKAKDLLRLMRKLATQYPTGEVHIIWDNLNIHDDGPDRRWKPFDELHRNRVHLHFHFTLLHASWIH